MSESAFTHWLELPEGTPHVVFGDLTHLIAKALWPDRGDAGATNWAYGGARVNLEEELLRAVQEGRLEVKNPLTLGPHTFPHGDALNTAVVLLPDLRAFLALRGVGVRVASPPAIRTHPVEVVAREAAALRHPIGDGASADERLLADAWHAWTAATLLTQLNGYLYDQKASLVVDGRTLSGQHEPFNVPKDEWRVDDAGRSQLLDLFTHDTAYVWPIFRVPPRPHEVPPVLQLLPKDTRIRLQWTWQRLSERTCSAADGIDELTNTIARQSLGWLRIDEAAQVLDAAGRGAATSWRGKFLAAAEAGALPTHEPGSYDRVVYGQAAPGQQPRRARDFYELVHVDDLDAWLTTNEPRLPHFRFGSAEAQPATGHGPTKAVQRQRAHENAILAKLVECGFTPAALPKPPAGKPSAAKQAAKAALPLTSNVFEKAWKRLRADKRVQDV
ncbi:hypothetical protein ACG02S_01020 [Roseateles sp. DC23W]|uniref:Uncharacterized protein n=1 Tax=Pelomonas dachongensis TaxID=3299029 RepID=A0ABW7EH24_9BURK